MGIAHDNDGHVRTVLGLYFLGGLEPADHAVIERHLGRCKRCLDEYDRVAEVTSYLDCLHDEDADELTRRRSATVTAPPGAAH
jgi:predicted anti-sigma-YlaC factor YlaD